MRNIVKKQAFISAATTAREKEMLQQACDIQRMTVSDLIRSAAFKEARRILKRAGKLEDYADVR